MVYSEHYYSANDGLQLYYRDYGQEGEKCPLLCLSGLTRNSGDFHEFAERYSMDRKVYALDYRGRGKSAYDPNPENYNPQIYAADIFSFLNNKSITRALFVGTSLGGLMTMAFAGLAKAFIAGAILNDVGPDVDTSGSDRILDYVGVDIRFKTLEEAAAAQKAQYSSAYPDLSDADWLAQCQNTFVFDEDARNFRFNYDMAIGSALATQLNKEEPVDLWPFFKALSDIPTLAIRGALSDILSQEVFERMKQENPNMETLVLKNRGHVPLLNEPSALEIMDKFIAGIR
jgi:pimeloyl-ACP methyl ester carboxylesterase